MMYDICSTEVFCSRRIPAVNFLVTVLEDLAIAVNWLTGAASVDPRAVEENELVAIGLGFFLSADGAKGIRPFMMRMGLRLLICFALAGRTWGGHMVALKDTTL